MARRLGASSSMAVVLLLAAAANVAAAGLSLSASASAAVSFSGGLTTSDDETATSGEQQQAPPPPPPPPPPEDPEKQKQKQKEHAAALEKAMEEEKVAQQEMHKYALEKHLVSPTNGTGCYKGFPGEMLYLHNELRARYDVSPVKWDNVLAREARRWSNAMRMDCQLKHAPGQHKYGQSVFRSHDNWNATAKDAMKKWREEEAVYDKQREKCIIGKTFHDCGHFALVVGKKSTSIGCGRAECYKGGVFITCNYSHDNKDKDKSNSSSSSSS